MDKTRLYFRARLNEILAQKKVKAWMLQKEHVTLALTDKSKLLVIYMSKKPQYFGRWQPHEYVQWHSN